MDFSSPLLYSDFIQVDSNSVFLSLGYVRERERERERERDLKLIYIDICIMHQEKMIMNVSTEKEIFKKWCS